MPGWRIGQEIGAWMCRVGRARITHHEPFCLSRCADINCNDLLRFLASSPRIPGIPSLLVGRGSGRRRSTGSSENLMAVPEQFRDGHRSTKRRGQDMESFHCFVSGLDRCVRMAIARPNPTTARRNDPALGVRLSIPEKLNVRSRSATTITICAMAPARGSV